VFRGVFSGWHAKAGAFSALPDAPVEPDDPPPWWRQLRVRWQKPSSGGSSVSRYTARARGCPAPSGDGRSWREGPLFGPAHRRLAGRQGGAAMCGLARVVPEALAEDTGEATM